MIASFQVSVDIFKGFPDEESIVNYTLNQAYQDNVTVFASEFLSVLSQGPLSYSPMLPPYPYCVPIFFQSLAQAFSPVPCLLSSPMSSP